MRTEMAATPIRRLAALLLVIASVAGCDRSPTQPSPRPPQPPAPTPITVNGEITIASMSPEPGATVQVRFCADDSPLICADQPRAGFEVLVDQDMPEAMLTVNFGGCGSARTPVTSLTAGVRTVLSTGPIDLSADSLHDGNPTLFCELPAVSVRTIVSLWRSGQPRTPVLTRQFEQTYIFAKP